MKRRGLAVLAALLLLAPLLIVNRTSQTLATWTDGEYAIGTFDAGSLQPVVGLACTVTGGALAAKTVNFTWSAPTTGVAPNAYEITWLTNTQVVTTTSYSMGPALLTIGTYVVTVKSHLSGTSWVSAGSTKTVGAVTSLIVTCT